MEKVLGKVMIVWKYGWDASTEYKKLDAVSYNGNSCICAVAVESHLGQQQGYGALKLCRVGAKGV